MDQALQLSLDFYDLGYWGIDAAANAIFPDEEHTGSFMRKTYKRGFQYAAGLAFARYGSELPIPLGVWAHEEFHRSVLGVADIHSQNGNWLLNRWDGTVYGVSDDDLAHLKGSNLHQLLYSYVAGVQAEVISNREVVLEDFYHQRSFHKNSLLLYKAWYVHNYFRFSTSFDSDSVKIIAPEHENAKPMERDFAGADLTAWAYDMFNPTLPYGERDDFPNGSGENRRLGFSDLSAEAQDYLKQQKQLSLINFFNPGIFFINRIPLGDQLSFNLFTQYVPTHFGNDISILLPVRHRQTNLLLAVHRYSSYRKVGAGIEVGWFDQPLGKRLSLTTNLKLWQQPGHFFATGLHFGGSASFGLNYSISKQWVAFIQARGKTKGFELGVPFLEEKASFQLGLSYNLAKA